MKERKVKKSYFDLLRHRGFLLCTQGKDKKVILYVWKVRPQVSQAKLPLFGSTSKALYSSTKKPLTGPMLSGSASFTMITSIHSA